MMHKDTVNEKKEKNRHEKSNRIYSFRNDDPSPRLAGICRLKGIPFVMVTAEGMKENVVEAVKAGVSNYVVKPFTPETFGDKIQSVFN